MKPHRPRVIRVSELASLLGYSSHSIITAARAAGVPLVNVRRVWGVRPANAPLYLTIESAAQLATGLLGKACDVALKARLRAIMLRQDNAFGPNPMVELAT